jgi:hypothetical protein
MGFVIYHSENVNMSKNTVEIEKIKTESTTFAMVLQKNLRQETGTPVSYNEDILAW